MSLKNVGSTSFTWLRMGRFITQFVYWNTKKTDSTLACARCRSHPLSHADLQTDCGWRVLCLEIIRMESEIRAYTKYVRTQQRNTRQGAVNVESAAAAAAAPVKECGTKRWLCAPSSFQLYLGPLRDGINWHRLGLLDTAIQCSGCRAA